MNLESLSYFVAAYEQGSIHKAARVAHISPQGLSQSVKQLEEYTRNDLFVRSSQGITPTTLGDQLYEKAKQALGAVDEVDLFLARCRNSVDNKLVIASCGGFNRHTSKLPMLIRSFGLRNPEIEAEFCYVEKVEEVYSKLNDGSVDAALLCYGDTTPGFHYDRVKTMRVVCVLSTNNSLASSERLEWPELANMPIFSAHRYDPFSNVVAKTSRKCRSNHGSYTARTST